MSAPLVSVIVPTYERPALLPRALDSIAAQTCADLEAIVVNDGGEDVSTIVAQYPFARCVQHLSNRGLPAARNTGIKHALGKYLAYLDDDDWFYPQHFEVLLAAIIGHRAAYSNAEMVEQHSAGVPNTIMQNGYLFGELLKMNLFPCNAVLHERSLIDEVGGFDEALPNSEDWDMWIRIGQITPWHHVPVVTCAVDRTRRTMSSNHAAMMDIYYQIRRRYENVRERVPA